MLELVLLFFKVPYDKIQFINFFPMKKEKSSVSLHASIFSLTPAKPVLVYALVYVTILLGIAYAAVNMHDRLLKERAANKPTVQSVK